LRVSPGRVSVSEEWCPAGGTAGAFSLALFLEGSASNRGSAGMQKKKENKKKKIKKSK
jgi:hypothetical protein